MSTDTDRPSDDDPPRPDSNGAEPDYEVRPPDGPSDDSLAVDPANELIERVNAGDPEAFGELIEQVYGELRQIASHCMRGQQDVVTWQPTALVHAVIERFLEGESRSWSDPKHFVRAAALSMTRLLIDRGRRRKVIDRFHDRAKHRSEEAVDAIEAGAEDLEALAIALEELESVYPDRAELVRLRYFAGLSRAQVIEILGIAPRTYDRRWKSTRAWLYTQVQG